MEVLMIIRADLIRAMVRVFVRVLTNWYLLQNVLCILRQFPNTAQLWRVVSTVLNKLMVRHRSLEACRQ